MDEIKPILESYSNIKYFALFYAIVMYMAEAVNIVGFGKKIIYQEAPQVLPPDLYKNIKSEIARRILSKNKEKWQTVNMAYTEIDFLRDQASNKDDEEELKKLDEINQFIMLIEKKYEIA